MPDQSSSINWKQNQPNGGYGAWVGEIKLTDTGLSVFGQSNIYVLHDGLEVHVAMNARVKYDGVPHRNPAAAKVVEALEAQEQRLKKETTS